MSCNGGWSQFSRQAGAGEARVLLKLVASISRTRFVVPQPNSHKRGQPTVGFEPTTRCLQIRQQLNSARNFGFPCIRNASIRSQVFLRVGYRIGYKKPSPKSAWGAAFAC